MSPAASLASPNWPSLWRWLSSALLAAALLVLIYASARIMAALFAGELGLEAGAGAAPLVLAAVIYLSGHGLRILRLALLIGGWRVGFRSVVAFHLMTAAVSLTAPLKLGELYRVTELGNLVGGFVRALMIAWWERAFDILAILAILTTALVANANDAHPNLYGIAMLSGAFVVATLLAFFVAPENLRRVSVLIIRRYEHPWSVPLLNGISIIRRAIRQAPSLVEKKVASLATLTVLIWGCEIASFALVFPTFSDSLALAMDGLLGFLGSLTQGQTLLSGLTSDDFDGRRYLAATQAPLALIGLLAAGFYAHQRFRRAR